MFKGICILIHSVDLYGSVIEQKRLSWMRFIKRLDCLEQNSDSVVKCCQPSRLHDGSWRYGAVLFPTKPNIFFLNSSSL